MNLLPYGLYNMGCRMCVGGCGGRMGIEGVGGWWGGGGNIPPPTIIIMVGMTLTKPWKMHKIRIPPLPWTPKAHLPGGGRGGGT